MSESAVITFCYAVIVVLTIVSYRVLGGGVVGLIGCFPMATFIAYAAWKVIEWSAKD